MRNGLEYSVQCVVDCLDGPLQMSFTLDGSVLVVVCPGAIRALMISVQIWETIHSRRDSASLISCCYSTASGNVYSAGWVSRSARINVDAYQIAVTETGLESSVAFKLPSIGSVFPMSDLYYDDTLNIIVGFTKNRCVIWLVL